MSALLDRPGEAFYGAVQALFGVTLPSDEGEVVALMGRNGMGKTTTIRTICRMMPHGYGRDPLRRAGSRALAAPQPARLGIGLVPEGRRCFANADRGGEPDRRRAPGAAGTWRA
jgi:branched-chain amino acid transport system ATP-binding protein